MQNRLPNKILITNYIDLYTLYKKINDKQQPMVYYGSLLQNIVEQTTSFLWTRRTPVKAQLQKILKIVEATIKNANKFTDWYKLIFILREQAEIAQTLKTKEGESTLRQTLHGAANLIIRELADNPEFIGNITDLSKRKTELGIMRNNSMETQHGLGVDDINNELDHITYALAMLGDDNSSNEASTRKLLGALKTPTVDEIVSYGHDCNLNSNRAAPLYLQRNFCVWLFQAVFQPLRDSTDPNNQVNIDFNRFRDKAIKQSEAERIQAALDDASNKEAKDEDEESNNVENDHAPISTQVSVASIQTATPTTTDASSSLNSVSSSSTAIPKPAMAAAMPSSGGVFAESARASSKSRHSGNKQPETLTSAALPSARP